MSVWIGIGSLAFAMLMAYGSLAYRQGHQSARMEELEKWRANMRNRYARNFRPVGSGHRFD